MMLHTEIISIASGNWKIEKTIITVSLAYALIRSGHRVLLVDAELANSELSLFLLGPRAFDFLDSFQPQNTFTGVIDRFHQTGELDFSAQLLNRLPDHGVNYEGIISSRALLGDSPLTYSADSESFQRAVNALFENLRRSDMYDYVLIDAGDRHSFESAYLCASADSYIVVTEPNFTSFYRVRSLVSGVNTAAGELGRKAVLRGILVKMDKIDKTEWRGRQDLDNLEKEFRFMLEKELPIEFSQTYPIPVDVEVIGAYNDNQIPYRATPNSLFCYASLVAFMYIFSVVSVSWPEERIRRWNELVQLVEDAYETKPLVEDAYETKSLRVFLCHAKEDEPQVKKVYEELKKHGYNPWLDKENLIPGQMWDDEIRKAIEETDLVMVFLSQTAVSKQGYVQKEFKLALDILDEMPEDRIYIIPVRLNDCEVPRKFRKIQWVDLFDFDAEGFDKILQACEKERERLREEYKIGR